MGSVKVTSPRKGQTSARFTVKLAGAFNEAFTDEALTNEGAEKSPRQVKVTVLFNNMQYRNTEQLRYSVKPGRTGHAKTL
jgi:hypothetical protein